MLGGGLWPFSCLDTTRALMRHNDNIIPEKLIRENKPWAALGVSRCEYESRRQWQCAGMSRDQFEDKLLKIPVGVVCCIKLEAKFYVRLKKIFGKDEFR